MIYTSSRAIVECKVLHTYNMLLRETRLRPSGKLLPGQPVSEGSLPADPSKNIDPTTIL